MFITALFTVAKTWKKPKCLPKGDDKDVVVRAFNGILLSRKK